MRPLFGIGPDVRGLQSRKRVLVRDAARARVGVEDRDLEGLLAEARCDQLRRSVAGTLLASHRPAEHAPSARLRGLETCSPDPEALTAGEIVLRGSLGAIAPVQGLRNPGFLSEEGGLHELDAADGIRSG